MIFPKDARYTPIKRKLDALTVFKAFKGQKKLEMGKKIKYLRTDNGREFCSQEFDAFCSKKRHTMIESCCLHSTIIRSRANN